MLPYLGEEAQADPGCLVALQRHFLNWQVVLLSYGDATSSHYAPRGTEAMRYGDNCERSLYVYSHVDNGIRITGQNQLSSSVLPPSSDHLHDPTCMTPPA